MNKKLVLNPNMATTPMIQFIKPPETFDIGGDAEKFIEECKKFFELTQTAEEHRGIFIKGFPNPTCCHKNFIQCKLIFSHLNTHTLIIINQPFTILDTL